jgi:hypothetical protein
MREIVKQFNVYNGIPGADFGRIIGWGEQFALPEFNFMHDLQNGAGQYGSYNMPALGMVEAFNISTGFFTKSDDFYDLIGPNGFVHLVVRYARVQQRAGLDMELPGMVRVKGQVLGVNFGTIGKAKSENPEQTISCSFFEDIRTGFVRTRWGLDEDSFIWNGRDYNLLTRMLT